MSHRLAKLVTVLPQHPECSGDWHMCHHDSWALSEPKTQAVTCSPDTSLSSQNQTQVHTEPSLQTDKLRHRVLTPLPRCLTVQSSDLILSLLVAQRHRPEPAVSKGPVGPEHRQSRPLMRSPTESGFTYSAAPGGAQYCPYITLPGPQTRCGLSAGFQGSTVLPEHVSASSYSTSCPLRGKSLRFCFPYEHCTIAVLITHLHTNHQLPDEEIEAGK